MQQNTDFGFQGCLMIRTARGAGTARGRPSVPIRPGRPWPQPLAAVDAGGKVTPPTSAAAVVGLRHRRRRTPADAGGKVAPPPSVAAVVGSVAAAVAAADDDGPTLRKYFRVHTRMTSAQLGNLQGGTEVTELDLR